MVTNSLKLLHPDSGMLSLHLCLLVLILTLKCIQPENLFILSLFIDMNYCTVSLSTLYG